MSKAALPPINNDLAPAPRQRVDLKGIKPREPIADEAIEANSYALGQKWGASTQLPHPEASPTRMISIRGYIPDYLDAELALEAAKRRVTKTFLIMEALAKAGYHVGEADLVEDRRRSRQKNNG